MRWAMCGDWAPMPMNVRGPKPKPWMKDGFANVEGMTESPVVRGRHYDVIVMDDIVQQPVFNMDKFMEACGMSPPSWAQKQLMDALERKHAPRTATEARMAQQAYDDALTREQEWLYGLRPHR